MTADIDSIHHCVEIVVNGFSVLFNCFLLYLVQFHSTFEVKMYKYLLTMDAFLDLCLATVVFFGQPVSLTAEGYFIMISNGFFAGRSNWLDSVFLSWDTRLTSFIIGFVGIGGCIISYLVNSYLCEPVEGFQPEGQHVLELIGWPKYENGRYPLTVGSYVTRWRMISSVLLFSFTCTASTIIVIWSEIAITKRFRQMGNPSHNTTRRLHKEFHRALLAMAIIPLLTCAFPTLWYCICITFRLSPGILSVIMSSLVSSITFFNPLTTIMFLRVFRQATIRFLTCGRRYNVVMPEGTTSSHIRSATCSAQGTNLQSQS
ncbi:serpentine type 7TM GPCR chemoreceptor srd domain-containing protein [Ditylenchus destructor]|uniref:Serpentine type 7TM GPCR chemoreceptor srd domain-containing protein n=1 Tax=Ditylenchus destructor TaxID=166010 RepID=A0AAD4MU94_9BILA|nr:serpentine type 7TM GPCR chemoreceptor srd domain-containing protein [Ditylenchus destructor]